MDHQFIFEIGGQSKNTNQIKNLKNAFIVADGIEYGFQNKIPLWMFGFVVLKLKRLVKLNNIL